MRYRRKLLDGIAVNSREIFCSWIIACSSFGSKYRADRVFDYSFSRVRSRWTISLSVCREDFDGMTEIVLSPTRNGHSSFSHLVFSFYHFSPLSRTALRFLLLERIPKHTDSLLGSSFHVAFAFMKFFGRKTDGEATVLGNRRVEKLWPRCETSVALFSTRTSLPNSSRGILFFFLKQDSEQDWNCFTVIAFMVHFQNKFYRLQLSTYKYLIMYLFYFSHLF